MLACLRLEIFGDDVNPLLRRAGTRPVRPGPWVARITGSHPKYKWSRRFERGIRDYAGANSVGSRGVHLTYWLPTGVYEVRQQVSWRRSRRYFMVVTAIAIATECVEIPESEVAAWLEKLPSASTC